MKAQWLGDPENPNAGPYAIEQYGITFARGQDVDIGALTDARADKLRNNPTFKLSDEKSDAKPVETDPARETQALKDHLRRNSVQFGPNTGLAKLREMAAGYPGPAPQDNPFERTGQSQVGVEAIATLPEIEASREAAAEQNGGE
jgi:hypothetical protein